MIFNFVKIDFFKKKLNTDMDANVIFYIIIFWLHQPLICHLCTLFAISDFSVTELPVETKIKMIFRNWN